MARRALSDDPFNTLQPQLEADGWIFYETQRYNPTRLRGYSPVPDFIQGSPATKRKGNKACYLLLQQRTEADPNVWDGTLRLALSALWPWIPGATTPITESDWAVGVGAHYLDPDPLNPDAGPILNPAIWNPEQGTGELAVAELSPVATLTRAYGDCSDAITAINAIRDLWNRITYPA